MPIAPGTRLGAYEIVTRLGAGGMGEVYRAHDTTLGRNVAIKVLPAALTADQDRVARFEREARVLASLNHPNIAAIHGFERAPDLTAIVMELVEGETLADRIGRGPLPPPEALAVARAIADALDAAHERGIVHRDLKPANIVLGAHGVVKVLDFGLAKTGMAGEPPSDLTHSPTMLAPTIDGMLLGTAPYMSPEQARGKPVDKRADIWAFGCVVYEMLTGRRAFRGETPSDSIAAILEREPDWGRLPASLPPGIVRTLRHCLEKDPRRRLRDIGDLAFGDDGPVAADRPSRARIAVASAIVVAAAAITAIAVERGRSRESAPAATPIERITFDAGRTQWPALSADGRLIAFASDRSGRDDLDIWVQQLGGGSPVRLTDDPADDSEPWFSPDGSQIVFRSERGGGGVFAMPALGGGPARQVVPAGRNPRFSPDGRWIAYWTGQFRGDPSGTVSSVFVVPLEGGPPTQLLKEFYVARNPVWAPDSKSLIVLARRDRTSALADAFDLWWTPIDGRPPVRTRILDAEGWRSLMTTERISVGDWAPDGMVLGESGNVWRVPMSSGGTVAGPAVLLAHGAGLYRTPAVSRDGTVVFAGSASQRVIERALLPSGAAAEPPAELHVDGNTGAARASQTADGAVIVFERRAGHRVEIVRKAIATGELQVVATVETGAATSPSVSSDGARIGYTVPDARRQSVTANGRGFVVEISGGMPKPVCDNCGVYGFLSDNRTAVVAAGDTAIQLIDSRSGAVHDILRTTGHRIERPSVSPDDRLLAWRRTSGTVAKVLVALIEHGKPIERGAEIDEPTTTGRPAGWSADSRTLYLLLDADGYRCLWAQRVGDRGQLIGHPTAARHFHDRRGANNISTSLGNAVAPPGFLYETLRLTGDLWLLPARALSTAR